MTDYRMGHYILCELACDTSDPDDGFIRALMVSMEIRTSSVYLPQIKIKLI